MSVTGIRFYVEGAQTGANSKLGKQEARKAFHIFLTEIRDVASQQKLEWHSIVICGSRRKAYDTFCNSFEKDSEIFHILLVDAEEDALGDSYSTGKIWDYLFKRPGDGWLKPLGAEEHHVYLMVRTMETWIVADHEKLSEYYKKNFNEKMLPAWKNIEDAPKSQVYEGLKKATEKTTAKAYHKTKHAFALLEIARPEIVKNACPSCHRLFSVLPEKLQTG
ncbi:DUF4276 family protein [Armatimonas sp.]|uniref:DUF4276 family protein n=1 Tax=Armatimonas sp. TaxID=1872638 RepID=UPI00375246D0